MPKNTEFWYSCKYCGQNSQLYDPADWDRDGDVWCPDCNKDYFYHDPPVKLADKIAMFRLGFAEQTVSYGDAKRKLGYFIKGSMN